MVKENVRIKYEYKWKIDTKNHKIDQLEKDTEKLINKQLSLQ